MTRCLGGLREMPAAAAAREASPAAARAAAPFFYALRRRRLKDQNPPDGPLVGCTGEARLRPRRSRPARLRDRVRAVSHRLRMLGELERQPTAEAAAERNGSGGVDGGNGESPRPARWVKKEGKEPKFFRSSPAKNRYVASYIAQEIALVQLNDRRETAGGSPVAARVRRIFGMKGLLQTEIYREAHLLASTIDDLALRDKVDIFRSLGAVRLARRLCAIELAIRPVTSPSNLDCAQWQAAAELEPSVDNADHVPVKAARAEGSKRLRARTRLTRILKKWGKPHGAYFSEMTRDLTFDEEDLRVVCRNLRIE